MMNEIGGDRPMVIVNAVVRGRQSQQQRFNPDGQLGFEIGNGR